MSVPDLLLPRLEKASDASVPGGRRGSLNFKALQVKPGHRCGRLYYHHSLEASKLPPSRSAYEMPGHKSPPLPPAPPSLFLSPSSLSPLPPCPHSSLPSHLLSASFLLKHERRTCYLSCHPSHLLYHANENKAPELFPPFLRGPFSPRLICFPPDEKGGCGRVGTGRGRWRRWGSLGPQGFKRNF